MKLGPLIYLARIMEVEKNQTILVAEGISDKLKRFNTFILPIGSLAVAVIGLVING
jgi:hypothetical protein